MEVASMHIVVARYRSAEEFLERYQSTFEHGGIFYPARAGLALGESVLVDVRLPNLRDRMLLRGMVAWRRPGRRRTGVRAGIGIEFLPTEAKKRDFLLALARAARGSESGNRRHRRLPIELQVDWRVPTSLTRHLSRLDDIGAGGAFIRTRDPQPAGTPVVLDLLPPGGSVPLAIEGRVAWTRATPGAEGIGVEFRCRDAGGLRRLKELVRRMEAAA
jgi:uncharacterized protein (TIGR02266 family)